MMAAYVTRAEIEALIPPAEVKRALEDGAQGSEAQGLFDQIAALAQDQVDGLICGAALVPLSADDLVRAPVVKDAARVFACKMLYARAGVPESSNPWADRALELTERLKAIGQHKAPLFMRDGFIGTAKIYSPLGARAQKGL